METQIMKLWKKQVEEVVTKLGAKWGFSVSESLSYLYPEVEDKNRGRPEKKTKKVVNKTAMVEDVIQTIMEGAVAEVAAPVVVEKVKKVTKKKEKSPAPAQAEATPVEPVAVVTPVAVEAVVEKVKKVTKKKEKSPAPAEAAPVVVVEPVAPVVVVEKVKKVTKKKEKSPAPAPAEAAPVVTAPVVVAAPVVVEPVVEKKKKSEKVAPVVSPVAPVKEKTPEPEELEEEEITEEDDNADECEEWMHKGVTYYKSCDKKCGGSKCDCTGTLFDIVSQDPVGTWNGKEIIALAEEED